ncbi:hypothetical protein [Endothiovibrio diazotrophicus]
MAAKKRGIRLKTLQSGDEGLKELFESASERLVGKGVPDLEGKVAEAMRQITGDAAVAEATPAPRRKHSKAALRALREALEATLMLLDADLPARDADDQPRLPFSTPDE